MIDTPMVGVKFHPLFVVGWVEFHNLVEAHVLYSIGVA